MKSFLLFFCACFFASCLRAAEQPNVLFLFADDLTHDALGCLSQGEVQTPNLDRLAERSKVFTHAYNMGSWSGAVCVASRTMLNTGKHVWRAQKTDLNAARQNNALWPQRMKTAGYRTFLTGKWHVATDAQKCFDQTAHVRSGMPQTVPSAYNRPLAGQADTWSPFDTDLGGYWQGGKHWSEVTADDAVTYLKTDHANKPPFFMYVAFNAPHDPRQSPAEFVAKYPPDQERIPASFLPEYPYKDKMGCSPELRDEKLAPFPRTHAAIQTHRAEYHALITHLDAQIGRVLDALEASGEADKTWIFFTADHGLAVGKHGLMGKQNMYEHSLRVPFLASGPGVSPGRIHAPIYLQDAMATALDLAGASRDGVEFKSLLPLIKGTSSDATATPVYGCYLNLQRAVVKDGWKLIAYPEVPKLRLYHVAEDADELHDLAEDTAHKDRLVAMFKQLVELQIRMDDPLDLKAAFPNL